MRKSLIFRILWVCFPSQHSWKLHSWKKNWVPPATEDLVVVPDSGKVVWNRRCVEGNRGTLLMFSLVVVGNPIIFSSILAQPSSVHGSAAWLSQKMSIEETLKTFWWLWVGAIENLTIWLSHVHSASVQQVDSLRPGLARPGKCFF